MMATQIWIRSTYYDPVKGPVTVVASKNDINVDIHSFANEQRTLFGDRVDVEIFEWEDDLHSATLEGYRRAATRVPKDKKYRDTLHDYLIATFLATTKKTMITPRSQTPLPAETIKDVVLEVMQHPGYKGQIVALRSVDGRGVMLEGSSVLIQDLNG
jgi:hypothetical protein